MRSACAGSTRGMQDRHQGKGEREWDVYSGELCGECRGEQTPPLRGINANPSQGQRISAAIGAKSYWECSSLLNQGVDDVFEAATRAAMLVREPGHGVTSGTGGAHGRNGSLGGKRRGDGEKGHGKGCCVIC
jgi:hypothetical protein